MATSPEPIDLAPYQPDEVDIMADIGVPISEAVAKERTQKFVTGMPVLSEEYSRVYSEIVSGREPHLRTDMAAQLYDIKSKMRAERMREHAQRLGRNLSSTDMQYLDFIETAANLPQIDPMTVMEVEYADSFTKYLNLKEPSLQRPEPTSTWDWSDTVLANGEKLFPKVVQVDLNTMTEAVAKRQFLLTMYQNTVLAEEQQGWGGWTVDFFKTWVPFYSEVKLRGNVPGVSAIAELRGRNLEAQAIELLQLPLERLKEVYPPILARLKADNPQIAKEFAHAMLGKSSYEIMADNLFTTIDLSIIPGAIRGSARTVKAIGAFNDYRRAQADVLKNSANNPTGAPSLNAEATGDVGQAATLKVTENIQNDLHGRSTTQERAIESLPAYLRQDNSNIRSLPHGHSQEAINRIEQDGHSIINQVQYVHSHALKVDRIAGVLETQEGAKIAKEAIVRNYPRLEGNVNNVSDIRKVPYSATFEADVSIGTNAAELFHSPNSARIWAQMAGFPEARIEPVGFGWKAVITVPLRETDDVLRDLIMKTANNKTPSTMFDRAAGVLRSAFWRTPEETLSKEHRAARHIATYGPKILWDIGMQHLADLGKLSRGLPFRKETVTTYGDNIVGFTTEKGTAYRTVGETTVRTKATEQLIEGEIAAKPASARTVYMNPDDAASIQTTRGNWRLQDNDGSLTLQVPAPTKGYRAAAENVPYEMTPRPGLVPVELYSRSTFNNLPSYRNVVVGDSITQLERSAVGTTRISRRDQWHALNRVMRAAQDMTDPALPAPNNKGYFFKSLGEFDDYYLRTEKRMPTDIEARAYFSWKRTMELDRILRNTLVYRNKARLGVEQHAFYVKVDGKYQITEPFEGMMQKEFPGSGRPDNILVAIGDNPRLRKLGKIEGELRKEYEEGVKQGRLIVVKVFDPENNQFGSFAGVGNNRVRYVLAERFETTPLSFDQVPRRGGGHYIADYDFYIKQPKVRHENVDGVHNVWYEGDITIWPVMIRSMGNDVAGILNNVRKLIEGSKLEEAKALVQDKLPVPWHEVKGWFTEKTIDGKKIPARLSLHEEIRLVPNNKSSINMDNVLKEKHEGLIDGTRSGSDARQHQIEFTGERDAYDLYGIQDVGSKYNPIYQIEQAKTLDPITSLNRGLAKIINSTFMDDYKIFAVEHWLEEARPYLKDVNIARYAPYHVFNEKKFVSGFEGTLEHQKLLAQHMQIQQLVGIPSTTDTLLHSAAQNLADSIYGKFGPKAAEIFSNYVLTKTLDPIGFMRSITFHAKLGFFNPVQWWVQGQTFVTIFGIAGARHAAPGTAAAFLDRMVSINPNMTKQMDKVASNLGWKPGELTESIEQLNRTGFRRVGAEYAALDKATNGKIVDNQWGRLLDAGTFFFKNMEENVRLGAWHTAFHEFRRANPTGKITDAMARDILLRADDLYVNMSRASSSILHQGILSLPTQFLSYQLRIAELFMGKRLTGVEKARLITYYSAIYGLPTTVGLTGLPFGDLIRQAAIEGGYTVGEDYIGHLVMEGLPSTAMRMVTGKFDFEKGITYNFGDRFGVQGFETMREASRSDAPWWSILGGAAYSTFANTVAATDPFWKAMLSSIRGDQQVFKIQPEHFADLFKEFSTFNSGWRLYMALNTQRWYSKREIYMADTSKANAVFMTLSGLQPQAIPDAHLLSQSLKTQADLWKHTEQFFIREFRRGLRAAIDNPEQARAFFTNAVASLHMVGYPEEDMPKVYSTAAQDHESLIERINWKYFIKDVPQDQKRQRLDQFIRQRGLAR